MERIPAGPYAIRTRSRFIGRYLALVLGPDSTRELLYSDYLVGYATVNLAPLALVSSRARHQAIAWALHATGALN